jgi:alkylhydroperoxidase/carboxymuconolactone decarboxylase family protein YurZ
MDNGLTQQQAGEVVTHLAFYAGWPILWMGCAKLERVANRVRNRLSGKGIYPVYKLPEIVS